MVEVFEQEELNNILEGLDKIIGIGVECLIDEI
jgi:hypothetical protein